jgi:hypothetical protein
MTTSPKNIKRSRKLMAALAVAAGLAVPGATLVVTALPAGAFPTGPCAK